MPPHPLATYLNDHLAGSVVALRLMASLESCYAEQADTPERASVVRAVRLEVEEERVLLERIVAEIGTGESPLRKTAGWFAERFTQLKLAADDDGDGDFRIFEFTEVITIGLLGKRGLWRALHAVADHTPVLRDIDFELLVSRAEVQYEQMERLRLAAARAALDAGGA
jgi:hypothetical protein